MKFIDHFSPEKDIIKEKFNTIQYMDVWISIIVEGYIYENISKVDKYGYKIENKMKYYKEGKLDGEYKRWFSGGQLYIHCYYKNGQPTVGNTLNNHCE